MRRHYLTMLLLAGVHLSLAATFPFTDTTNYLTLARQYQAQGNRDQAIKHYELAKANFAQEQDYSNLVYVLTQLASIYTSDTATHVQAETYLDSAQLTLEEKQVENDTLASSIWYIKAELAKAQRKNEEAIAYFKKSLELKQAFYGESHPQVADNLDQIGRVYLYRLQNPYISEQYHQQAIEIGDRSGDKTRLYANCLYSLSVANRLQSDYDKALAYGSEALQRYNNLLGPYNRNVVLANHLLGSIYADMDSIEDALRYNRKVIELAMHENLSQLIDISLHYNNQAEYHFQKEEYDSTIYYAQLSLEYRSDSTNMANSYQFLGNAYRGKGQLNRAFRHLRKSKEIKEAVFIDHHTQLATLYVDLGRAFAMGQQIDSAQYYYQKALVNARISQQDTVNNTNILIQTGDDLATMQEALNSITNVLYKQYYRTGDQQYLVQALPYFMLFDQFMDLSRRDFSTEGSKLMLSSNHKGTYERAITSSYELHRSNPADSLLQWIFYFTEKSKAMVLLESIRQAERSQRILPDSLVQQYQSLQAQLAYYQSELINAEQDSAESSVITELQTQKADVLQELEVLNQYIQTLYPNYYDITYRDMVVRLDSLRKYIPPHQPVLSYFWGDSAVYALLITSDIVKTHRVKDMGSLNKAIARYQDVLVNDAVGDPSYANFLQFQESAHTLYQMLLEPILPDDTIEHLTIVPDGDLTTIPFESLITSKVETDRNDIRYERLPYLIRQYNISYEFSLSIAFGERYAEAETDGGEIIVTAFGIKNFDHLPGNQRYSRLGGAEREVRYVQEKFPQARIFLNAEATEAQFKQRAPEAHILHIATHGMADTENPFASKFIFYPDEQEDGILHLYELYNIPLKSQLLLLSACESGVGKHYVGEGNFSLARSFIYAGCKSVIMSLWQVNDIITERLIQGMYDRVVEQQSISETVRDTKLAFIEGGTYAHPQCWAGMVPLGNSSLKFSEPHYGNYIVIVLVGLGLGFGAIYLVRLLF